MPGKAINQYEPSTITNDNDAFLFQHINNTTNKITWSSIASKLLSNCFAEGNNVRFSRSGNVLTISALGSGGVSPNYTSGDGIDISEDYEISFKLGANLSINSETGNIDALGGATYTSGDGIDISAQNEISVKMDDLEGITTTTPGDMFIVQTASGETKKLLYAALCGNLLYNDIKAGNNITLTPEQDSSGVHLRISSTGGGQAATIAVGTTTTGAAGTDAAVTNSGTTSDAVFNFTIPRGADGQNGSNGQDGDDGYSISAITTPITGGHRVTISSTNPSVTDETFDVMDGVTTIQTTSVNTTVTLTAANWTGNDAPYTQTVNVSGITAQSQPLLDISVSDTTATGIEQIKQWGYISKAVTSAGSISFSCYENKPTVDLTVKIKVV